MRDFLKRFYIFYIEPAFNSLRAEYIYLLVFLLSVLLFFFLSIPVHAEEIAEGESQTDTEQNERLNSLEIRLEELGYTINELQATIESVQTSELEEEQQRLVISEKLDLLIIGVRDLINYSIESLTKQDNKGLRYRFLLSGIGNAIPCGKQKSCF